MRPSVTTHRILPKFCGLEIQLCLAKPLNQLQAEHQVCTKKIFFACYNVFSSDFKNWYRTPPDTFTASWVTSLRGRNILFFF